MADNELLILGTAIAAGGLIWYFFFRKKEEEAEEVPEKWCEKENQYIPEEEWTEERCAVEPVCAEGDYFCDLLDPNVSLKCVDGQWIQWQSCSAGCNPFSGQCFPPSLCVEGTYRCSPTDPNILQRCVNNEWVDWQSCAYGCESGECN